MKSICAAAFLFLLAACSGEKREPANAAPARSETQSTATQPATQTTASETGNSEGEPVTGKWVGELRIDAHAGMATLNYVGPESGDFVPMRFRTDSAVAAKIFAECADQDLCEVEGTVQFLNEPPPQDASAVGRIIAVDHVKKLPPETR